MIAVIVAAALQSLVIPAYSEKMDEINQLKDLCIDTVLVQNGKAKTVIALPNTGLIYTKALRTVQNSIVALTGSELPVVNAMEDAEKLLGSTHVIALGNMATNAFIKSLYMKWFAFLDLKYPGDSGYVLRSVHDPFGTGKNVILIGGSDEKGVEKAASAFATHLKPGNPLTVGWLLEVRLGNGIASPPFLVNVDKKNIFSWRDSRRGAFDSNDPRSKYGYEPATFFGWNPISIAGVLYLMTGEPEYLDAFKKLAMPDVQRLPKCLLNDDAFENPMDPLVKSYHYRSHLLDLVWDLIEESPLFDDTERLYITNRLLDRQIAYDPKHTYTKPNPDRHAAYHMLCIYTGSRYFSKSYPNDIWDRRMRNIREGFRSLIGNPTWATRDTLTWVPTSIEPVVDYYTLDGPETFIRSGTLAKMMEAIEVLYSGKTVDEYNKYLPISLLHKASFLLNDQRYAWMAHKAGFDLSIFRIGQSYWPTSSIREQPPSDMVHQLKAYSLARTDWDKAGQTIPEAQGFQIASYRSDIGPKDDYLLFDGFEGLGRHRYQLATIKELRLFGRSVLSGYENDVDILKDGLASASVPRSAALKTAYGTEGVAYLEAEVPDMPGARWSRHVLMLTNETCLVLDRIEAIEDGVFDIAIGWRFSSKIDSSVSASKMLVTQNGVRVLTSDAPFEVSGGQIAFQKSSSHMTAGNGRVSLACFLPKSKMATFAPISRNSYAIRGMHQAYIGEGFLKTGTLDLRAGFSYIDKKRILLTNATLLRINNHTLFESDAPCFVFWDLVDSKMHLKSASETWVVVGTPNRALCNVPSGEIDFSGMLPIKGVVNGLIESLEQIIFLESDTIEKPADLSVVSDWQDLYNTQIEGTVLNIAGAPSKGGRTGGAWISSENSNGTSTLYFLPKNGKLEIFTRFDSKILSIWPAMTPAQREAFHILVGCRDDSLVAFNHDGNRLWNANLNPHPSFKIGNRYDAPWFTDPETPYNKQGVNSILVGDIWSSGVAKIVVGRPSTMAFFALDGTFIGSTPVRWGDVCALAVIKKAGKTGLPLLLAAKCPAGNPALSAVDQGMNNVSDSYLDGLLSGYTNMHAWLQRGTPFMKVKDIDNDGKEEVIYALSGHWNEVRVYDGSGLVPRWVHYLGPADANADFVSGLAVSDLDRNAEFEVVVGTRDGWLLIFNADGTVRNKHRFSSGVTVIAPDPSGAFLAVGLEDGSVLSCNPRPSKIDSLGVPVSAMDWQDGTLYVGGQNQVRQYMPAAAYE